MIANVPWMPIVGNHEFYSGSNLTRYLDSTWEKWGPLTEQEAKEGEETHWSAADEAELKAGGKTTATSPLGAMLSAGNHHAAGLHSKVPSKTSRYFSVDFGLVHMVGLSLNGYNGVDLCKDECNKAELEWLQADLAAVDRSKTPWVIATSHFPMYLEEKLPNATDAELVQAALDFDEPWYSAEVYTTYTDPTVNSLSSPCCSPCRERHPAAAPPSPGGARRRRSTTRATPA